MVGGIVSSPVLADQWQTRAELRGQSNEAAAQTTKPASTQMSTTSNDFLKHRAPNGVTSGERLLVKAKIAGKDGVKLARVYFKTASSERYNFVVLNKGQRGVYSAEIPAAGNAVSAVEYKIVVQNAFGEVYKTEKYSVPVNAATSNEIAQKDGFIDVFSEYPENATETSGFIDNVRYTYGATKLVTSVGSSVSVASSGSGYVGGASSSASGTAGSAASGAAGTSAGSAGTAATGTAAGSTATAATAASTTSLAAVGAGSVAVAAVGDPSGTEGNDYGSTKSYGSGACFDGFLEFSYGDEFGSYVVVTEFKNGLPYAASGSNSELGGCITSSDVDGGSVVIEELEFPSEISCVTVDMIDAMISDSELDAYFQNISTVSGHSCPVIVNYSYSSL